MSRPLFRNERALLVERLTVRLETIRALGIELSFGDLDDVDAAPIAAAKMVLEKLQHRDARRLELGEAGDVST